MEVGKIKKSVLERSVLRPLYGQNFAQREVGSKLCVVEGWTLAPQRIIYGTLNEAIASGVKNADISLQITLPQDAKENQLKELMKEIEKLCEQEGCRIASVQVKISVHVTTVILSGAVCGGTVTEKTEPVSKQNLDIVSIGSAGCEGAAILSISEKEKLLMRYTESFLEKADHLYDHTSFRCVQDLLIDEKNPYCVAVGEGGFFAALWELSERMKAGFDIALKNVPIAQHAIEVCEFFGLNPYQLLGGGAMLIVCENGSKLAADLKARGVRASVIGKIKDGKEKTVRYDDEMRNLEAPKMDEIYKVLR